MVNKRQLFDIEDTGRQNAEILLALLRNPVQCTCLKYGWAVMYAYKMVCIYIRYISSAFASKAIS